MKTNGSLQAEEVITQVRAGRLYMSLDGISADVAFEDGSSLLSRGGRAAYRACLDLLEQKIGNLSVPAPRRPCPRSILQRINEAREVRVYLDPDYAGESPHCWTVKVQKPEARAIVGRADGNITGVVDDNGVLLLHPLVKKETA